MRAGLSRIQASVVTGVACLAPLPYGSDAYGWICVWLAVLAVCVLLRIWTSPLPEQKAPLLCAAALGVGIVCLALFQSYPGIPSFLNHPAWRIAAENGISGAVGRISIDVAAPIYALALPLAIILAFVAGYLHTSRRSRCWRLIKAFTIAGAGYALIGILLGVVNPGYVLFEHKAAYESDFTGTFVNRNTAASYFGVCLLAAGTLAFRQWRESWPGGYLPAKERLFLLVTNLTSALAFWSCVTAGLLVAVFLTSSRAGVASSALAAAVLLFLLIRKLGRTRRKTLIVFASLAGLLMVHFFGTGTIVTRVNEGLNENGRYKGWASSWDIVKDYPVFGTGLGTFRIAYPAYRQDDRGVMQVWERAHSTPLEIAVELGLPAAVLVVILTAGVFVALWRCYYREGTYYTLPALAFSMAVLAGVHSLVDFPLQVPGCVIPIAILFGAMFRQFRARGVQA